MNPLQPRWRGLILAANNQRLTQLDISIARDASFQAADEQMNTQSGNLLRSVLRPGVLAARQVFRGTRRSGGKHD